MIFSAKLFLQSGWEEICILFSRAFLIEHIILICILDIYQFNRLCPIF
jgi:hypothetical protein